MHGSLPTCCALRQPRPLPLATPTPHHPRHAHRGNSKVEVAITRLWRECVVHSYLKDNTWTLEEYVHAHAHTHAHANGHANAHVHAHAHVHALSHVHVHCMCATCPLHVLCVCALCVCMCTMHGAHTPCPCAGTWITTCRSTAFWTQSTPARRGTRRAPTWWTWPGSLPACELRVASWRRHSAASRPGLVPPRETCRCCTGAGLLHTPQGESPSRLRSPRGAVVPPSTAATA